MSEFKTALCVADEKLNDYIVNIVKVLAEQGKGKPEGFTHSMSLAISVVAQVFLSCGGNIDKGEVVGEMVKQGLITTLKAYKDMARITHWPTGGLN